MSQGPIVVRDPKKFAEVFQHHEQMRFRHLDEAIVEAAAMGQRVIRAAVPVDLGGLRRETNLVVHGRPPGGSGTLCEIVESTPYAAAIEAGTRPFTPPFSAILAWATRQASNVGLSSPRDIQRFAHGVWMGIRRKGIKAKWSTRDALPKLRTILGRKLKQAARTYSAK